jgi:hypothetical protein
MIYLNIVAFKALRGFRRFLCIRLEYLDFGLMNVILCSSICLEVSVASWFTSLVRSHSLQSRSRLCMYLIFFNLSGILTAPQG